MCGCSTPTGCFEFGSRGQGIENSIFGSGRCDALRLTLFHGRVRGADSRELTASNWLRFCRRLMSVLTPRGESGRPAFSNSGRRQRFVDGNSMRNTEPTPGVLSTSTRPSCASTIALTIARPSPVPPARRPRPRSVRAKRLNMRPS